MKYKRTSMRAGLIRMRVLALSLLGFGVAASSSCNEHPVGSGASPEFRGITVPLPPPSFRGATVVDVELSGVVPGAADRVIAWDTKQARGIVGPVDRAGNFALPAWGLNVQRHCIEVRGADGLGNSSSASYYAMDLVSGPACQGTHCSAQDSQGECVCLVRRSANCVDAQPWPAPGTQGGATSTVAESGGSAVTTSSAE